MPHKDPEARKDYMRQYYQQNREKRLAKQQEYYETHRAECNEASHNWYIENRERAYQSMKRWKENHPGYHAAVNRLHKLNLRRRVIEAYGSKCVCCGETRIEFLTVDHTKTDGAADARLGRRGGYTLYSWLLRNGCPKDRYRLLCWNCNCARGVFGWCPHEASLDIQPLHQLA